MMAELNRFLLNRKEHPSQVCLPLKSNKILRSYCNKAHLQSLEST